MCSLSMKEEDMDISRQNSEVTFVFLCCRLDFDIR